jgi:hypothetical protein
MPLTEASLFTMSLWLLPWHIQARISFSGCWLLFWVYAKLFVSAAQVLGIHETEIACPRKMTSRQVNRRVLYDFDCLWWWSPIWVLRRGDISSMGCCFLMLLAICDARSVIIWTIENACQIARVIWYGLESDSTVFSTTLCCRQRCCSLSVWGCRRGRYDRRGRLGTKR